MTRNEMLAHLRSANEVARDAAAHGHHPFGSVLVYQFRHDRPKAGPM